MLLEEITFHLSCHLSNAVDRSKSSGRNLVCLICIIYKSSNSTIQSRIPQADFEEDRRVREALTRSAPPPAPPPSPQARPSRQAHAFNYRPGRLTALQRLLSHSATTRIRLGRDPFGVLESPVVKETRKIKRPKFKPTMLSITKQLEYCVEAERSLMPGSTGKQQEQTCSPVKNKHLHMTKVLWFSIK